MRVVFLVPRRRDGGHRDRLWEFARARWESILPEWPIYEGHHDTGPFNRSEAINLASDLADEDGRWDVAVVLDSDVMLRRSAIVEAVDLAASSGLVTWPHTRWRGLSELWTKRTVDDRHDFGPEFDHDDMDVLVERTNPLSWSCAIAIPRVAYDALGGFDERFRGWGYEDMAFQSAVVGLLGFNRLRADVYHLWHPRSDERISEGSSAITAPPEYVNNARLGRRYMIALRRDHDRHDRVGEWLDTEERERDIANLLRDDARFEGLARRLGLEDWSGWYPTLEELVEGAKAARLARLGDLRTALIVRTGGDDDRFDDRIGYLERSLASLVDRVSGPIERRVVFSDWSDELRPRVVEVAERFGFYVVGSGHVGYTESVRRLWRYIERRVTEPFLFVTEDDFEYLEPVDLVPMLTALRRSTRTAQIALLRGPCYPREFEAGGILGWDPSTFTVVDAGTDRERLEHRNFWTMNPFVARREIASVEWPKGRSSERLFGDLLFRDGRTVSALWGDGRPWIAHLGETRASTSY